VSLGSVIDTVFIKLSVCVLSHLLHDAYLPLLLLRLHCSNTMCVSGINRTHRRDM
jgi:hypothetical protein